MKKILLIVSFCLSFFSFSQNVTYAQTCTGLNCYGPLQNCPAGPCQNIPGCGSVSAGGSACYCACTAAPTPTPVPPCIQAGYQCIYGYDCGNLNGTDLPLACNAQDPNIVCCGPTPTPTPTPIPCNLQISACGGGGCNRGEAYVYSATGNNCPTWYNGNGCYIFNYCPCVGGLVWGACNAPANTCNTNNGTQTGTYTQDPGGGTYCTQNTTTRACTINDCNATYQCNAGVCQTRMTVNVFFDNNADGVWDAGDTAYPGTIQIAGTPQLLTNGTYSNFYNAGTYNVAFTDTNYLVSHIDINGTAQTFNNVNPSVNVNLGASSTVNIAVVSRYSISGNIFTDYDLSHKMSGSNTILPNAGTVSVVRNADGVQVYSGAAALGTYTTGENLVTGTYTVTFTENAGNTSTYQISEPTAANTNPPSTSFQVTINETSCTVGGSPDASCTANSRGMNGSIQNLNFGLTPLYTIQGLMYSDVNQSKYYTAGVDTPVAGGALTVVGDHNVNENVTINNDGTYTVPNLLFGTYTLTYGPGNSYHDVYPPNGQEVVTVGRPGIPTIATCNADSGHATDQVSGTTTINQTPSACDGNGNITGLNFGSTNQNAWWQIICSDVRTDSGIVDPVPNTGTCGTTYSNGYALIPGTCSDPGIAYTGNTTADFGTEGGAVSTRGWLVGGSQYPENFTPVNPQTIRDSYNYLMDTIKQNSTPTTDLSVYCTPNSCALPTDLPGGIYTYTGNVNFVGPYTLPANANYIFAINGAVTFSGGSFLVPSGTIALFATTGDITVAPEIGETDPTSFAPDLMGVFVTDKSFIISRDQTKTVCTASGGSNDLKLNIVGSVTVNASYTSGTFQNQRDLCSGDRTCPTYTLSLDNGSGGQASGFSLILMIPDILKHPNFSWQEVPVVQQ